MTTGDDQWQSGDERHNPTGSIHEAKFDLTPFRDSYRRVTVVGSAGKRAWSNPIWP